MAAAPKVAGLKTRFEAAAASAKQAKTRPDNAMTNYIKQVEKLERG